MNESTHKTKKNRRRRIYKIYIYIYLQLVINNADAKGTHKKYSVEKCHNKQTKRHSRWFAKNKVSIGFYFFGNTHSLLGMKIYVRPRPVHFDSHRFSIFVFSRYVWMWSGCDLADLSVHSASRLLPVTWEYPMSHLECIYRDTFRVVAPLETYIL